MGKAIKVAQHIRRPNTLKRVAASGPLVTAVNACVLPVGAFGGDIWWPGITRPTKKGTSPPQTTHLCDLIDKAIRKDLRAAFLVWETTSNVVIQREIGIPPAQILLKGNRLRVANRLNSLDNRHPLRSRASTCPNIVHKNIRKRKDYVADQRFRCRASKGCIFSSHGPRWLNHYLCLITRKSLALN